MCRTPCHHASLIVLSFNIMIGSVVLSLLAATSVAAAAPKAEPAELKTVPGAYIVEFDEGAVRYSLLH